MSAGEIISLVISVVSAGVFTVSFFTKKDNFVLKCRLVMLCCVLVVLRSLSAMAGHILNDDKLMRWFGSTPMPFSTALCLIIIALCICWIVCVMETEFTKNKEANANSDEKDT